MSLKNQVAHGLKWKVITVVGRQLISLVVFATLARLLDPAAFGLVGLVGVYIGFVGMFIDQGMGMAIIQKQNLERGHLHSAFWFNIACAVVLCVGTVALAQPISVLLGEPHLTPLLRWSSLGLIIGAFAEVQTTLFSKNMDFRSPAIRTLVANIGGGVVGVGMAVAGYGVWALVGQQLASALSGTIFLWVASTYRPQLQFSFKHLRDLLHVSASVFATGFLWYFSSRLDRLAIGRFAGMEALGLYVVAGRVPDLMKTVVHDGIADVSLPALSKIQHDYERMRQIIYKGMELNAVIAFAVFGGLAAVSYEMVPLLFGAKWAAAGGVCALLSLYLLANALQVFFQPALLASGGTGRYVLLNVWHTSGVVVACFAGVQFGVEYLVIGMILNSLIVMVPALMFLRKRIGLSALEYCRPCLVPALAALAMGAAVWLVKHYLLHGTPSYAGLVFEILAGAAGYLGFIFVFNRPSLFRLAEPVLRAAGRGK